MSDLINWQVALREMYSPIKCGECKWCELVDGDYMCRNPRSYVVATAVDYGCVLAERKENDG